MAASSSQVLTQILSTLKDMNRTSKGVGVGTVFEGSAAAGVARSAIGSAINAAPLVSGTLGGHLDLLAGSIGSDSAMVKQVVYLTSLVNNLRGAWLGANQEVRNMATSSAVGIAGLAAIAGVGSKMLSFGVDSFQKTSNWSFGAADWASKRMASSNPAQWGSIRSNLIGQRVNIAGFMQGQGIAGAGATMNAMFGESYAGDALEMGGVGVSGYYMHRALQSPRFMAGASPLLRMGGRLLGYGAIAAEAYAASPRGPGPMSVGDMAARGLTEESARDKYRSLAYANEYGVPLSGLSRSFRNAARGEIGSEWRAAQRVGIYAQQDPNASWFGSSWQSLHYATTAYATDFYHRMRPWTDEENVAVAQETTRPGSYRPPDPRQQQLNQLTMALNFQSRQMDVGDLHGSIQQEAVRTPMEQQRFENLITSIENLTKEMQRVGGGGSTPSTTIPPA